MTAFIVKPAIRPAHHFKVKADDSTFDSTAGLQDMADSGETVHLPIGTFYSDQINFNTHGSRIRGSGAFNKFRTNQGETGGHTIIRYNGAGGSGTTLFNLSLGTNVLNDAQESSGGVIDLKDVGFSDLTLDANGNSIASDGSRNSDGAALADYGAFLSRCGNNKDLAKRFTIIGSNRCGLVALGLFTANIEDFGLFENERSACWIGFNKPTIFDFDTKEIECHSLAIRNVHIRNNGVMAYDTNTANWIGGGDQDGAYGFGNTSLHRGAAVMMAGHNCVYEQISHEFNGGPIVYGNTGNTETTGSVLRNAYIEANEANSDRGSYATTGDQAIGLMFLNSAETVGNKVEDIFLNGGSSNGIPEQIVRLHNVLYSGNRKLGTQPGTDESVGPPTIGEYPRFINVKQGGSTDAGSGSSKVDYQSQTAKYFVEPYEYAYHQGLKPIKTGVLARKTTATVLTTPTGSMQTLATVTVPAGTMRNNGHIRITAVYSFSLTTSNSIARISFGAANYYSDAIASGNVTSRVVIDIWNRDDEASQIGGPVNAIVGETSGAKVTSTQDTTADVDIDFNAQIDTGDTVTLEAYLVEIFPAD